MTRSTCDAEPDAFVPAVLKFVRRCPARADYLECVFVTGDGWWRWCFSKPIEEEPEPLRPLALTVGRYGAQAHSLGEDGEVGPALPNSAALPMIRAGAPVSVARRLVERGL